ncbi:MAG: hypothetical protein KGO96_07495 [Elusimicrobia bacterium]|nr:hypothetical protein [Elusimicrobiota bacterium]
MMKIVYLDVDGILLDFNSYIISLYEEKYNYKFPKGYLPGSWGMTDCIPGKEIAHWKDMVPEDWPSLLKSLPGARDFIEKLRDIEGVHIILVTALNQKKQIYRIKNLRELDIYYDEIFFTGYKQSKANLIEELNDRFIDRYSVEKIIFVDDKLYNCVDVLNKFEFYPKCKLFKVYSIDMPYNDKEIENSILKANNKFKVLPNYNELFETILKDLN